MQIQKRFKLLVLVLLTGWLQSCSSSSAPEVESGTTTGTSPKSVDFTPYTIEDSARIVEYGNGVQVYTVVEGPGDFPKQGQSILVDYHGLLAKGEVFDSSYERGEPLKIQLGKGQLIEGFEYAVQRLRLGSKAIAIIPPEKAYGDRQDVPNVPPNSTLYFHLEVLGTF